MNCRIDGNTFKKGLTSLLDKELLSSGVFQKEGDTYTLTKEAQSIEAQEFANILNRRFSEEVIKRIDDSTYSISISDNLLKDYVVSTEEGQETVKLHGLHFDYQIDPNSWNQDEMFTKLNFSEISEMTNNQLKTFLKSINPEFRIEEIDNLSVDGVAHVKDFLIQVRTMSKFKAIPEEVAHVF